MKHIIISSLAVSTLFFTSCRDAKSSAEAGADASSTAGVNKDNLKPLEVVQNWNKDVTEGRVASLWDSLTAEYQGDLNTLAHTFGEKVDAEVYNEAMGSLAALSDLLKNKKGMILEILKEQTPEEKADDLAKIVSSYDSVVGIISTIATSDSKDAEGMKKLEIGKLMGDLEGHTTELAVLGSLAGENFAKMKNATFTLVSESGDSAAVSVTGGPEDKEVKLTKKDGRWLPEEMVTGWPEMLSSANKKLDELGEMKPEDKQKALMGLGMVKTTIKGLESAKTKEELMEKAKGIFAMIGMMGR